MRRAYVVAVVFVTFLYAASSALAAGWSEHWIAAGKTAVAITGDVTLRTAEIDFANGKSLPITKLKNIEFTDDTGTIVPATLYKITKPADPFLLGDNRLCGGPKAAVPVTFIVIWRTKPLLYEGIGRGFAPYSGEKEPAPTWEGACGIYGYELGK